MSSDLIMQTLHIKQSTVIEITEVAEEQVQERQQIGLQQVRLLKRFLKKKELK